MFIDIRHVGRESDRQWRTVAMSTVNRTECRPRSKIAVAIAMSFIASLLLPAVGSEGSAEGSSDATTLRIGFLEKVDSMNPNVALTETAKVFHGLVYDCLQAVGECLEPTSNLAVNWKVDEDYEPYGSAWSLDINPSARWHDGTPFTVEDVIFTINLNADNYTWMWPYQPYAYFMSYAEKVDDDTVRIHFYNRITEEPMPAAYAQMICIPILPKHMLKDKTAVDISFSWLGVFDDSDPPIVGTGPFMATEDIYDEFIQGDKLTLVRNPNYHLTVDDESPRVSFERLEMLFYENESAMMEDLENGDLDLARFRPTEFSSVRDSIDNDASGIIQYYHGQTCSQRSKMLDIDMRNDIGGNPARLDPAVRQAIMMAVNKTEIVSDSEIYGGFADEGTTLVPSLNSRWHYEPPEDDRIQHDFQAANDLLEENGYRYTPDSPDVRIATADSWAVHEELVPEDYPLQFELVIFRQPVEDAPIAKHFVDACEEIGITIEYSVAPYALPLLGALCPVWQDYEMTLWSWTSDIDPVYQLFRQSSRSIYGWNDNYYNNSAYDENYTNSVMELNESKRQQYVYNCQKIHYEDSTYISLAYVHDVFAWRTDRFQGWTDCSSEPGASLANTWGANPLLFALEPVGEDEWDEQFIIISIGIMAIVAVVALAMLYMKRRRAHPG